MTIKQYELLDELEIALLLEVLIEDELLENLLLELLGFDVPATELDDETIRFISELVKATTFEEEKNNPIPELLKEGKLLKLEEDCIVVRLTQLLFVHK